MIRILYIVPLHWTWIYWIKYLYSPEWKWRIRLSQQWTSISTIYIVNTQSISISRHMFCVAGCAPENPWSFRQINDIFDCDISGFISLLGPGVIYSSVPKYGWPFAHCWNSCYCDYRDVVINIIMLYIWWKYSLLIGWVSCLIGALARNIIQMVTGLEGSIMECHPEGSLLPKAAGRGQQWSRGVTFHYTAL